MKTIEKVGVVGAGTMGNGIAQVFAQKGHDVVLVDVSAEAIERALAAVRKSLERLAKKDRLGGEQPGDVLARIRRSTALSDLADRDLVVEAIVENETAKRSLFAELDGILGPRRSWPRTPPRSRSRNWPRRPGVPSGSSGCTS